MLRSAKSVFDYGSNTGDPNDGKSSGFGLKKRKSLNKQIKTLLKINFDHFQSRQRQTAWKTHMGNKCTFYIFDRWHDIINSEASETTANVI